MEGSDILGIPLTSPEKLFTKEEIKKEYLDLVHIWHPDKNEGNELSTKVMAHINYLYNVGLQLLKDGVWVTPNELHIHCINDREFVYKYKYSREFELGILYVGHNTIMYHIEKKFKMFYDNAVYVLNNFEYDNPIMEDEFKKYLPSIGKLLETSSHYILSIPKTFDIVPLSLVLKYYKGAISPKHVAWIISTLQNILCYLNHTGYVHNDISLDNYFISPKYHSGYLLGGWWYTSKVEMPLKGVPDKTYNFMSEHCRSHKIADKAVDTELVRALARLLLGDKLFSNPEIPKVMIDWVRTSGSGDPIEDYSIWKKKVLPKAFGPPKFIAMETDINKLYTM